MCRRFETSSRQHKNVINGIYYRPVLEYACQVWQINIPNYLSDDIERVQRRALKIILRELSYTDVRELIGPAREFMRTILFKE